MVKVAMVQMDIEFGNPAKNFSRVGEALEQAKDLGAEVVVFPEMWNTGYDLENLPSIADRDGRRTKTLVGQLAKQLSLNVVAGSVATLKDGRFYNTTYTFDQTGKVIAEYDKAHRFGPMQEDQYVAAGNQPANYEIANLKSASLICYDLRFPEWWRTAGTKGVNVYFLPAEWPTSRIEQWEALLKARAIENQAFVIGVNRVGDDPNNHFNGHSMAVAPSGEVLANADEQAGITIVEIDQTAVQEAKQLFDIQNDRRPELYR
ncbi:carbon-nitrogen family hydrolase [Lactobacillus alvi]|uniref:Carbon-nitrogen family hydrolase n=1 Tax=Limosilactobacillus alvi TaxID=990412 RepID=A0ABS2EQN2_9LACO|nr:carbon-nitrogen family hydrolase [Limosilactobacillus alvi]